ncbi:4090_t:CDS:1, partial [Dentiscutata heterogama]
LEKLNRSSLNSSLLALYNKNITQIEFFSRLFLSSFSFTKIFLNNLFSPQQHNSVPNTLQQPSRVA